MNAIIVGCSHRKAGCGEYAALDLYEGGCVPQLRGRVHAHPSLRERIFVLSARYGLVGADDRIASYDQQMTLSRARELARCVGRALTSRVLVAPHPRELLVLVEPAYLVALAELLRADIRPRLHWFPDPAGDWPAACEVIDNWGWPQ
ncbi:DUF6884 domain-containing protein [Frankia sp. Cr1]|uniref:DUF6884 domain-containing protein n=1 Tax=Frankia sp. Cr1 TaxID=3073931 RepID=UPI002AD2BB34|nr:DUF6884 domain-containing protein [Frankia sp. Cr1]